MLRSGERPTREASHAEAGATLPELMARLGHATPAAALVYLHARSDRDHALTGALGIAMSGAQAPEGREGSDVTNR